MQKRTFKPRKLPKCVKRVVARGHEYFYFNRPSKGICLRPFRAAFGTDAFYAEHSALMAGKPVASDNDEPADKRFSAGTWGAVVANYQSTEHRWNNVLKPKTKHGYESALARIERMIGKTFVSNTQAIDLQEVIDATFAGKKSDGRQKGGDGAARTLWTVLRLVAGHARAPMKLIARNPMDGDDSTDNKPVRKPKLVNKHGFHTVEEAEVEQYRTHHGNNADAMWLCEGLLGSGARSRSDFAGLSWNNVRDGYLVWTPKKTDESTGAMVRIKIADKHLKAALATRSKDDRYFLQSREGGGPWSDSHIGKMFRQWCREAGLSDRVVMHGLRKLFATRMADAGASVLQIAAALGDTPESAMGYIKKRNTSKLSDDAIDLIAEVDDAEAA